MSYKRREIHKRRIETLVNKATLHNSFGERPENLAKFCRGEVLFDLVKCQSGKVSIASYKFFVQNSHNHRGGSLFLALINA
jgi:hypothetical protein